LHTAIYEIDKTEIHARIAQIVADNTLTAAR